jgi:hypothetical protein
MQLPNLEAAGLSEEEAENELMAALVVAFGLQDIAEDPDTFQIDRSCVDTDA